MGGGVKIKWNWIKADLECLSRIESAISSEKKSISAILLSFLVRVENMLAGERQRRKARERKAKKQTESLVENNGW